MAATSREFDTLTRNCQVLYNDDNNNNILNAIFQNTYLK